MNNPHEVLNKVNQLLNNNGLCLIKILFMEMRHGNDIKKIGFKLMHQDTIFYICPKQCE